MTLSREARIILAILAVALAVFVWVNYYNRTGGFGDLFSAPQRNSGPATITPDITLPTPPSSAAADNADGSDAPPVAPTASTPSLARDIRIAELPFLVTEPIPLAGATAPAGEAQAGEAQAGSSGEQTFQRASVNPFSPLIVVQAAPSRTEPAPQPIDEIRVVDIPSGPPATAGTRAGVRAPAPAALVPNGVASANLPRALPSGMLPGNTEILRAVRSSPIVTPADDVPGVDRTEASNDAEFQAAMQEQQDPQGQAAGSSQAPLVAGTSPLSRYLRNNNVVFTGSVLGPVGVGVFRSSLSSTPVVVALGKTLPNTSIVLTSLKGQQAVLTQGQHSQTLILDLRR